MFSCVDICCTAKPLVHENLWTHTRTGIMSYGQGFTVAWHMARHHGHTAPAIGGD